MGIVLDADNLFSRITSELERVGAGNKSVAMRYAQNNGFSFTRARYITNRELTDFHESSIVFTQAVEDAIAGDDLLKLSDAIAAVRKVRAVGALISDRTRPVTRGRSTSQAALVATTVTRLATLKDLEERIAARAALILQEDEIDLGSHSSLLFALVEDEQFAAARRAVEKGLDIHRLNQEGATLLLEAAAVDDFDDDADESPSESFALALVERGIDIHAKDRYGLNALYRACDTNKAHLALQLVEKNCDINDRSRDTGMTPLLCAASSQDDIEMEHVALQLIEKGASIHAKDNNGMTALHYACQHAHLKLAKKLIEMGAVVDATASDGITPLMLLIMSMNWCNCEDCEKAYLLIDSMLTKEQNINAATNKGETALYLALEKGSEKLAKKLMAKNADIHAVTKDGKNMLYAATFGGLEELALHFIDSKLPIPKDKGELFFFATVNMKKLPRRLLELDIAVTPQPLIMGEFEYPDNLKRLAPFCMITGDAPGSLNEEIVKQDIGSDALDVLCSAESALKNAILGRDEELALLIAERTKDISILEWELACMRGMTQLVQHMSGRIQLLNRFQGHAMSYLLAPCQFGLKEVAIDLINRGAPLQDQNKAGMTPLLLSLVSGMPTVVEALLTRGVSFIQHNSSGYSTTHAVFESGLTTFLKRVLQETGGSDLLTRGGGKQETPMRMLVETLRVCTDSSPHSPCRELQELFKALFPAVSMTVKDAVVNFDGPLKDRFEIYLLLDEEKELRLQAAKMEGKEVDLLFSELKKKYPKADFERYICNVKHTLSVEHFKKGAVDVEVPPKPAGVEAKELLSLLKGLTFLPGELFELTDEDRVDLKKYFESTLLKRLKTKKINGLKAADYPTIEAALCHIAVKLKRDPTHKKRVFQELLNAAELCAGRIYNTTIAQYMNVVAELPTTYESLVIKALSEYRKMLIDSLVPNGEQSLHDSHKLMKAIGQKYAIPGWNQIEAFDDVYLESGEEKFDLKHAEERFLALYNPHAIVTEVVEPLLQDGEARAFAYKWHSENMPVGFKGDSDDYLTQEVVDGTSIKRAATFESLKKLGVIAATEFAA